MKFATIKRGRYPAERYRTRLIVGVTLSLLFHGLLLSLQFGIPGLGLPGLELPWNARRAQPELSVRLANVLNAPAEPVEIEPERQSPEPANTETPIAAPEPARTRVTLHPAHPPEEHKPAPAVRKPRRERVVPKPVAAPAPPTSASNLIAQAEPRQESFAVPPPSPADPAPSIAPQIETPNPPAEIVASPAPDTTTAKLDEEAATQTAEQEQLAQQRAEEESARRLEELGTKRQEEANAQRQAKELEARRQTEQAAEAARAQAAALALQKQAEEKLAEAAALRARQLEAQKLEELKKQEEAKAERRALELEEKNRAEQIEEAARQQAALARQKQAEELAAKERAQELANRQKAEAEAAQQRERERIAADNLAAAGTARGSESKRPGDAAGLPKGLAGGLPGRALEQARKLDLQRIDPPLAQPSDSSTENPRRRSLFGSVDTDIGLTMYIQSWRLKIERNGSLNYAQSSIEKARYDPVVTVAIRSDGSIEDIVINRSSGRPELDEAVRRIIRINARYSAFPPNLARRYDVIEIRRVWNFDETLRILEEVR